MTQINLIITYFCFLLICCLLLAFGGFAAIVLMLILPPLGYVIPFASSILFYSLLVLPGVLTLLGTSRNIPLSIGGVSVALIVALVPGWLGNQQYEDLKRTYRVSDVSLTTDVLPKTLKLTGYYTGHDRAPCEDLCRDLLLRSNAVIVYIAKRVASNHTAYKLGDREKCNEKHVRGDEYTGCLIGTNGSDDEADIEIIRVDEVEDRTIKSVVDDKRRCQRGREFTFTNPYKIGTITILESVAGKTKLVERMTTLSADVAPFPYFFSGVSCGVGQMPFHVASHHVDTEKADTRALLQRRYGLKFEARSSGKVTDLR